jgi:hypothetical protein
MIDLLIIKLPCAAVSEYVIAQFLSNLIDDAVLLLRRIVCWLHSTVLDVRTDSILEAQDGGSMLLRKVLGILYSQLAN